MIPDYTLESLQNYVKHHMPPGDFLEAVLCNDLCEAFARADDNNIAAMFEIVQWVYCRVPSSAWRSKEKVEAWLDKADS
jgi:hypothetical protein